MPYTARALVVLALVLTSRAVLAQDSLDVSVLGRLHQYSSYSDIWGYTTQSGDELALLGTATGTSIVDVSDPTSPAELQFIAGPTSVWRDIKTHDEYAYIVTEDGDVGIQIVHLEAKPQPTLVGTFNATLDQAHNIGIFEGVAYAFGASLAGSSVGTRLISLANPTNPVDLGAFTTYYVHDGVVRNDTLWAAAIANDLLAVVDVSNPASPSVLTTFTWQGASPHKCDLSPDGRYLFTSDETTGGDMHVFDVSDLGNVREVASWLANPDAIIHNVLVRGDLAYISYYTEGVRIVDVANPEFPVEVGFYDTWPGASGGFNGAWGVYPHAASGHVYASDISSGLYVLDHEQTAGALEGTVGAAGEGITLPGADVRILDVAQTQSNSNGFYKLYHEPGTYMVITSLFGFESDTTQVQLLAGAKTAHDVNLVRVPGSPLSGTIVEAGPATALESVSVVVQGTPLMAYTDASGAYELPDVPHGVYTLSVSLFGYTPASRPVVVTIVAPGVSVIHDFALSAAALSEDFESGPAGWFVGSASDNATAGTWVWSDPVASGGGSVQPEDDHSEPGELCWVTGNAPSRTSSINAADVDGGRTTLTTSVFDLSTFANPHISYWRWFSNDAGFSPTTADTLRVDLSNNAGIDWVAVERVTESSQWTRVAVRVLDHATPTTWMRLRFVAEDLGSASTVEAAIDDLRRPDGIRSGRDRRVTAAGEHPAASGDAEPVQPTRLATVSARGARLRHAADHRRARSPLARAPPGSPPGRHARAQLGWG
jgi:choice-of-anchor B domain-containing protein